MEKDTRKTLVVFRKFKENGDVIALFPKEKWDDKLCASYMHVGQHSGADFVYCINITEPATNAESKDLYDQLVSRGYNLDVIMDDKMRAYLEFSVFDLNNECLDTREKCINIATIILGVMDIKNMRTNRTIRSITQLRKYIGWQNMRVLIRKLYWWDCGYVKSINDNGKEDLYYFNRPTDLRFVKE